MVTSLRLVTAFLLAALTLLGCQLAPPIAREPGATLSAPAQAPLFEGRILLSDAYGTQASAGQVRANATVTLLDPATQQAKGTGITAANGTFTVQALGTFTPAIGGLYLLESAKTLAGAGNPLFRLRTLVQFTASGWTSVSGASVQLSATTTAVSLFWDHLGLVATDVIGKVSYDAATGTHVPAALNAAATQQEVQQLEALVQEALLRDMDPVQFVRPGPGGAWRLGVGDRSRNMLLNPGFEDADLREWMFNNPVAAATYSSETGTVYEGKRSIRYTVTAAGDTWLGQGYAGFLNSRGLSLEAGKTYTYSFYGRGAVGGERLQLQVNPQTGASSYTTTPAFTLTTAWQRFSFTFTATSATTRAIALFRPGSVAGQATFPATVYVDAIQLEEGGGATGYAPQGRLMVRGFANADERVGTSFAEGRTGTGVVVDLGVNLAPNASFEADGNADGVPDSMFLSGVNGGQFALDPDVYRFGAKALKVTKGSANEDYVHYLLNQTFLAGHTYTFSVWVKGQGVAGSPDGIDFGIYLDPYLPTGPLSVPDIINYCPAPVGTFGWTRISVTHTFVNTCASAKVIPMLRRRTGTAWFDGFQVEEADYPTPYAGDSSGLDTLAFDAARYLNRTQGSIAFWLRPSYHWGERPSMIFGVTRADNGDDVFNLDTYRAADGTPQLRLQLHDGLTWNRAIYQPTNVPWRADTWHHVATTWGPRGMELYLDGERVATHAYAGSIFSSALGRLLFAGSSSNFTACAQGTLDGLQIWDAQQSPEWVKKDYLGLAQ